MNLKADFIGIGKMRGVGWAIFYQDPTNGRLSNTGSRYTKSAMCLGSRRSW